MLLFFFGSGELTLCVCVIEWLQAMGDVKECVDSGNLRFSRCDAVNLVPNSLCADATYAIGLEIEVTKSKIGIDDMSGRKLDTLAAKFHQAIQEDCGLNVCTTSSLVGLSDCVAG